MKHGLNCQWRLVGRLYLPCVACPWSSLSAAVTPNAAADLLTDARGAALGRVLGFILVIVGFVVFDDVVLTAEERDHT